MPTSTLLIVDGDVVMNANGQPTLLSEATKKVRQDLSEMLAIEIQDDGFGAGIVSMLTDEGIQSSNVSSVEFLLREKLYSAAQRFMALQKTNLSNRDPYEIIVKIPYIDVLQDRVDPRLYRWRIDYLSQAEERSRTLSGRI